MCDTYGNTKECKSCGNYERCTKSERGRHISMRKMIFLFIGLVLFLFPQNIFGEIPEHERKLLIDVWTDFRLGRWHAEEQKLKKLVVSPLEDVVCQARFAEGCLWQHRQTGKDLKKATDAYKWIVEKYPKNKIAPWALLSIGRIPDLDVLNPDPESAILIYRRVLTEYPESQAAQEAVLHLAEALFQSRGKKGAMEAVEELKKMLVQHPDPQYTAQIHLLLGKLYRYPLEDYCQSVNHLSIALDLGLESLAQQSTTCLTIAILADRKLDDRTLAIKYYYRTLKEFPRNDIDFLVKQRLKQLGVPIPKKRFEFE